MGALAKSDYFFQRDKANAGTLAFERRKEIPIRPTTLGSDGRMKRSIGGTLEMKAAESPLPYREAHFPTSSATPLLLASSIYNSMYVRSTSRN